MGHNDRRREAQVGGGFERAASEGRTWCVRPIGKGWRLERIDPNAVGWLGGATDTAATPFWDAPSRQACTDMVAHIDRHEARAARMSTRSFSVDRPSPIPGITLKGRRDGLKVMVTAVDDAKGGRLGFYMASLSGWQTSWVLGEQTFDGGSTVQTPIIGKGLGRALYDLAEEMAGVALTPHGRYGTTGGRTALSTAFWDKRALHQRVPDVGGPAVAARDAERIRVAIILSHSQLPGNARDPYLISAIAKATGWDVAYVMAEDGSHVIEAWFLDPQGVPFSGSGPDNGVPSPSENDPARLPESVRADAEGYAGVLEGMPWHGPDTEDPASAHRSLVAAEAEVAAVFLDRYAGITVSPDRLRSSILGEDPAAPLPAR